MHGVYESGQKIVKDKLEAEIIMQHRKRMNTGESCVVQRGRKMEMRKWRRKTSRELEKKNEEEN